MMPQLDIFELDQDELLLAWPLVRTALPDLQPDGWQAMAEALIDRGGGVVGVASPDRILHGVATYEALETPRLGRVLSIGAFVTFELGGRAKARHALLDGLHRLSAILGCSATVIASEKRPRLRRDESRGALLH